MQEPPATSARHADLVTGESGAAIAVSGTPAAAINVMLIITEKTNASMLLRALCPL